jgi:plasmid stability protein
MAKEPIMPQLIVCELDPEVVEAMRKSAAAQKRSAGKEHSWVLRANVLKPAKKSIKAILASMPEFKDDHLFDVR